MAKPANVLYLTLNPNRQSTTVPTEGWFRFLADKGLRPVLVSRELGTFHEWAVAQGIPAYQDPLPFPSPRRPWAFLSSLWRLWRIIRRHQISLIHCNEHDVYPVGQYLARLAGIPAVVSVHFTMDAAFCRWAFGGRRVPARMFFVSQRSLDACRPALAGVVPASRLSVLHNGLDLGAYRPDVEQRRQFRAAHGIDDGTLLIGTACAFRARKQLEHLFEAAARLEDRHVHVLLAGFPVDDEREYAKALLTSASAVLGDRLHFVGELNDMRGFCNALDLCVNTSREESFGISVLEALACGCPVVGYDSKAVDEVVLPDGGEIVAQDSVDDLTHAIGRWLPDHARDAAVRAAARRQAERFDLRVISDQLWQVYRAILD